MKVLNFGQKSDIDILCFLHVSEVPESEKVVFGKWSECLSVCKQPSAQTKRDTDFKFGTIDTRGHGTRHEDFRKNRACAKGSCHRTFYVLGVLRKNGSNDFCKNCCGNAPSCVLLIPTIEISLKIR